MGGTFDPIHIGHLIAASEVHSALNLDSVWFIPARQPWQKADRKVSAAEHRLEMTKRAIEGDPRFEVSDIEINRDGPTRSVETVKQLKTTHPNIDIFWIVGADVATRIPTWHEWEEFVAAVTLVVVNRPDSGSIGLLPFEYQNVEMPSVRISATQLRERYAQGLATKYLVPDAVDAYIKDHHLFGA